MAIPKKAGDLQKSRTFKMPADKRQKIANSVLLTRLLNFATATPKTMDKHFMPPHQVTAAIALLKKILPDLSNIELTSDYQAALHVQIVKGLGKPDGSVQIVPGSERDLPGPDDRTH